MLLMSGVRLNNHCERDAECRASQGNSVCSKLLHICQCRSVIILGGSMQNRSYLN